VLALSASDWVEPPHANNLLDGVAGTIVGVGVRAQYTAEIRLEPQFVGRDPLVAALVYAVALHGTRNVDLYTHVQPRESIVATDPSALRHVPCLCLVPVEARDDLVLLVVRRVCEGIDVGSQACRRRSVYARDMVVYANLLCRRLDGLLYEVHEIWRAKFAERLEGL
jgi:hypothetical protein